MVTIAMAQVLVDAEIGRLSAQKAAREEKIASRLAAARDLANRGERAIAMSMLQELLLEVPPGPTRDEIELALVRIEDGR